MDTEPYTAGFPSQDQVKEALDDLLGHSAPDGMMPSDVYPVLADHFCLSKEARMRAHPDTGEELWPKHVRWAREKLKNEGRLDGSERGVWKSVQPTSPGREPGITGVGRYQPRDQSARGHRTRESSRRMDAAPMIRFPALRGVMGKRPFYVAMFELSLVPKLFKFADYHELPPEQRAQRVLNWKRVPEIARYIQDNEEGWLFSSLTASFDGEESFTPVDPANHSIGLLEMPLSTEFLINDGQHRKAAIDQVLQENPVLGKESISVVLFQMENLERCQQMFSDLNRTVQKTSRSLDILYDHRDPLNAITLTVSERVPVFKNRVEKDRVSLATRSPKFITLSGLYDANAALLGAIAEDASDDRIGEYERVAIEYWKAVCANIREWKAVAEGEMKPSEARMEYVHCSAVVFWALGSVGRRLLADHPDAREWKARIEPLKDIDWRRTNKQWQGICMLGTDIITRRQTRDATTGFLEWKLGIRDCEPERVLLNEPLS